LESLALGGYGLSIESPLYVILERSLLCFSPSDFFIVVRKNYAFSPARIGPENSRSLKLKKLCGDLG
jgi:hypothetical protein